MTERAFFDTNVLVYLHDKRSPQKRLRAAQLFESHLAERNVYLSTEVLQEFFVAITQKLARVPVRTAKDLVSAYARLHVVTVGTEHILKAIDCKSRYHVSFRDALILAAAGSADAAVVYSEDLGHGQRCDGVRVVNPFAIWRGRDDHH